MDKVKILFKEVKRALEQFPEARDNDGMIIALIWYNELTEDERKKHLPFLDKISKGEITNPESVRRTRQFVQTKHPELYGESRTARKSKSVEIKNKILNG